MAKICFPHHSRGIFGSVSEAYSTLKEISHGWSDYMFPEIVQYNVFYRDYLRANGMDALIELIIEEAPELGNERGTLNYLRSWWSQQKRIADYDIQCYHINDSITVLGHHFNGLEDVMTHCMIFGRASFFGIDCFKPSVVDEYSDIHIGELYENYPKFDSFDSGDDRAYHNFIFRTNPISEREMKKVFNIPHKSNFCMVHENIPFDCLPVLYYVGDGDYMLLASEKRQTDYNRIYALL